MIMGTMIPHRRLMSMHPVKLHTPLSASVENHHRIAVSMNSLAGSFLGQTLGFNGNTVQVIIPATDEDQPADHHRWREYVSSELQPSKFPNHTLFLLHRASFRIHADAKNDDASRAGTNAHQPENTTTLKWSVWKNPHSIAIRESDSPVGH